jgi:hypothetical protein
MYVSVRVTHVRDVNGTLWYVRNGEITRIGNMSQGWIIRVRHFGSFTRPFAVSSRVFSTAEMSASVGIARHPPRAEDAHQREGRRRPRAAHAPQARDGRAGHHPAAVPFGFFVRRGFHTGDASATVVTGLGFVLGGFAPRTRCAPSGPLSTSRSAAMRSSSASCRRRAPTRRTTSPASCACASSTRWVGDGCHGVGLRLGRVRPAHPLRALGAAQHDRVQLRQGDALLVTRMIEQPEVWGLESISGDALVIRLVQKTRTNAKDSRRRRCRHPSGSRDR